MNQPAFKITVRSGPVKVAVVECERTESGVKLLSVTPELGPTPVVADIIKRTFVDVGSIRSAIRKRWSRDGFKLFKRIELNPSVLEELNIRGSQQCSAQIEDGGLVITVDDGNCVINKPIDPKHWKWLPPTDPGLQYEFSDL